MTKIVDGAFPYETMEAVLADDFRRLGGRERAFALLRQGYRHRLYNKAFRLRREALLNAFETRIQEDPGLRKKFADLLESQVRRQTAR